MDKRTFLSTLTNFLFPAFIFGSTREVGSRKPELILYPDGKTPVLYFMEGDMTITVHPTNGKDRTYRVQNGRFYDWRGPTIT